MKKTWIRAAFAMLLMLSLVLTSCVGPGSENIFNGDEYEDYNSDKESGNGQFDFPGNYVAPELKIDGIDDDAQWANAKTVATFGHGGAATIKLYRGEQALFFFVKVADTILATEGETNDDAVTRSDSVEIYIDTLANGGLKPQNDDYQINLGIHGKTRIMQGSGSGWGGWNGLIDYEVQLDGVLNDGFDAVDVGYSVEVMIPYSQIGIEKDDTIAVSFGQVDKVAAGASATIDWDWYGWAYNGKIVEPQTPDNYLILDKDNNVMSRDEESKPNADMAGYVFDYATGAPVVGATVTVTSPEGLEIAPVVTDTQGYYVFEKVNPDQSYTLSVEKDTYFSNTVEYTRAELRDANGGRVLKNVTLRGENDVDKTTVVGTVKNIVKGAIEGVLVVVDGTTLSATTDANGNFTIAGVPAEEAITIIVSKDNYGTSKTTVPADQLVADGESNVGDVNINLGYAQTGGFGNKSAMFADSTMSLSRTLTGVEILLSGTRVLSGNIEIYLDVKECADHRDNDATMWRFDLRDNGTVGVNNYAAEGEGSAAGLEYVLYYNDSTGYSARFFIPYTYLGIAPLEVFGISLGQWSTSATDWDGWGFNGQFIAPETPKSFVRVSATNELYRQEDNVSMVNLSGNAGISGVKVEVNGISTVTGADGAWSMKAVKTSDAVNIVYSRQGYISHTTTIPASYFDTNYSYSEQVTLEKQTVTISGVVTNDRTGAPVVGATVSIVGTEISVITDDNGQYTIAKLGTEEDITLKIELENYATKEESISATTLASQSSHTLNISLTEINYINYITLTGKITNVNGPVEGVKVSVVGNDELSALTNENGEFVINGYPAVDCVLHIEKSGYISQDITMKSDDIAKTATEHNIGEIDLLLEYAQTGVFANKSDAFAAFVGYVTRSKVGFEFKFVGGRAFTGRLELFVDVKTSAGLNARDTSDYQFNLNDDGSVQIINWGEGVKNETVPQNMVYTVENADTAPVLYFTLPYDFFGQIDANAALAPTEVIGISAGQWMGSDWDGWGYDGSFVAPENPTNYIRISATNELYRQDNNASMVNLSGNAGIPGVKVEVNGISTVTGADGAWSMKAVKTSDAVNIVYSRQGYITLTTTIPEGHFDRNNSYSDQVTLEKQFVTLSGVVTNDGTGAPVAGATVSISGTDISVTTGENGQYTIANLGTEADVKVKIEAEGYITKEESISAPTLASKDSHTLNISLVKIDNTHYVTLSGKITNVNGPVAGVSVSVVGNSDLTVLTNENGEFVINGYPAVDCVLHIEKSGYISQDITMKADDIAETATEHSIGEIDFILEYEMLHGVIADKADTFAAFIGYVTRSKVGFEFKFVGSRAFTGQFEFFVDTKTSAGDNARDTSDYLFLLKADGGLQIINWGEGVKNETVPQNMVYTVENAGTAPVLTFTLPYDFFGQVSADAALAPTEVIGISAGQWMGSDWDGWDNFNLIGINNAEFVRPEWPQDYVRIAADNTLYAKADNEPVDFSSYQIHFGTGMMTTQSGSTIAGALGNAGLNADDMYAKVVKRDENGVTFEIITTGSFGTNTNTNEKEMILIYFDTGSESTAGWTPDYLIKIASDGTVYGKASAWWSASDADKLGTMATITTENGVTKIVYTVTYGTLGIGTTDVFGIAMREASHNAGDHMLYDPWHDCYFNGQTTGIDAADCAQFIRVAADGTLYRANSNQ